jgi:hypothetical protein
MKPPVTLVRRPTQVILALCLALFLSATTLQAQAWETIDDAEGATGEAVYQTTVDSAGNIFAAGYMRDAAQRFHAVIMKSSDRGATWETVVDYPAVNDVGAPNGPFAVFTSITSADVGGERHLVATGMNRRVSSPTLGLSALWLTIRSRDGGATWETLDEYAHPDYNSSLPRDMAMDANGNLYMVTLASGAQTGTGNSHWLIRKGLATAGGMVWSMVGDFSYPDGYDPDHGYEADGPTGVTCVGSSVFVVGGGGKTWTVRKSSNGGSTWQVVDSFRFFKNGISGAFDVAANSAGHVYVAGYSYKMGSQWFVRRSINGGSNWSTVDQFNLPSGIYAEGRGITVAPNGNIHVTGMASSTQLNWVTRERSAETGTWSTTDNFSLAPNQRSYGKSIAADPTGNLFSAGYGYDSAGVHHGWIMRRKPAP